MIQVIIKKITMDDIPETLPLKKSSTHMLALPSISKTQQKLISNRTARSNTTRHHSVFLDKIKDLTKDVKYDELETKKINEQQKQLKYLLRQFNQQTYHILGRYIDKSFMLSKNKKQRSISTSLTEVKDRQIQNSNNMLELCKKQIQGLQKKCQNLKYVTVEDFEQKIGSIKNEIEQLRGNNKQIAKQNTLRGLAIKKGDIKNSNNHEISELQEQKAILQRKKQRLRQDTNYVNQQQQKLKDNQNKVDEQMKKLEQEYTKHQKQTKQSQDQKQLSKIYQQKKRQFETKKEKMEKNQPNKQLQSQRTEGQKNGKQFIIKVLVDNQLNGNKQTANIFPISLNQNKSMEKIGTQTKKKGKKEQPKQMNNNRYQYQYLKMLKQLDQTLKKIKQHENNIHDANKKILIGKQNVKELEQQLEMVKKKSSNGINRSQTNDKNQEGKNKDGQNKDELKQGQNGKKWFFF